MQSENNIDETILSSQTDDTDIIESSIIEYKKNGIHLIHKHISKENCDKNNGTHKKLHNNTFNNNINNDINTSLRLSLRKNYDLELVNYPADSKKISYHDKLQSPIQTPVPYSKIRNENSVKGTPSLVKKFSPNIPSLSKTKWQNIENWLQGNNFESTRTPPFADLSVTPVKSVKKVPQEKDNREELFESSSMDSEVEGVLRAVYGADWSCKNEQSKCKTEPKKRINKNYTPVNNMRCRKALSVRSHKKKILSVNNDILNCSSEKSLEGSVISGIEMINLDDSCGSLDFSKENIFWKEYEKRKYLKNIKKDYKDTQTNSEILRKENSIKEGIKYSSERQKIKTPTKTFLASLSVSSPKSRCHPEAQYYKVHFSSKKEELVKKLFKLYNNNVFDNKLADDMVFSWNVKLRGTAGYCYNKRVTKSTGEIIRMSRIEFSTKIVDRADRLRDTMIHELCHAASWVIDGMLDGHGVIWSSWAKKATQRFPELPMIKRCHNYDIVTKYVYRCTGCGYSIKRHSKSINTDRKRCGFCYGVLELLLNKRRKGKSEAPEFHATKTFRTPNKFALFVKANYHNVKSETKDAKHAQIMKILSQQYALTKSEMN